MKGGAGPAGAGMQRDGRSRLVVHQHGVCAVHRLVQEHGRHVHAKMRDVVRLRPEGQAADPGVESVGADNQVEPARCGTVKGDVDDHVVEAELRVVVRRVDQRRTEVRSGNLHLPVLAPAGRHPGDRPAGLVDEDELAHPRGEVAEPRHEAQVFHDVERGPTHVDRVATGPDPLVALHHGRAVP